jgi:hypothetical protein
MATNIKTKPRFTFIKRRDVGNHFDNCDIILHSDELVLTEVLEDFTSFLRACGYTVKGELVIEEPMEDDK